MSDNRILNVALKALDLNQYATISDIRKRYFEKTGQSRFKTVFLNDESIKKEFQKLHESYVIAVREYVNEHPGAETNYYPADQIFNLLFNQGIYFLIKENMIKAGEKFEEAERLKNNHVLTKIYLGILLMKRKNYYAAEKYFLKALEFDKDNSDTWYYIGYNYMKAGKYQKASDAFTKAKELNPFRKDILEARRDLQNLSSGKKSKKGGSFLKKIFKKG